MVVLGALGLFGLFGACGEDDRPNKRRKPPDKVGGTTAGGEGGESGSSGTSGSGADAGASGSSMGGASGAGGRGTPGGRGGLGGGGGGGSGKGGSAGTGGGVPCGFYDCSRLPHVRPGAPVECVNGVCVIPSGSCEDNYAHCSTNTNVGCEADLRSSNTCGNCTTRCFGTTPVCSDSGMGYTCATGCTEASPDRCGGICVDVDTDVEHCGQCFASCTNRGVEAECEDGECIAVGPCTPPFGDCDDMFGCETEVTTPEHCGACDRNNCGATNATPDCSSASACTNPSCDPGYGNCDRTSLDCESTFGASCFPRYAGTRRIALVPEAVSVGVDGSFALAGDFSYEIDFDASLGVDRKTSLGQGDAYVTRFDANGTYAWTRIVASGYAAESVQGIAIAPDGSPIVVGTFFGTSDLDPGPAVDEHRSNYYRNAFVSKLSPAGTLTWARSLNGEIFPSQVAVDADGAVYVSGFFTGQADFDPGAGEAIETVGSFGEAGFLLKLDASGNYVWSRFLHGASIERLNGVSVAPDGTVWTIGTQNAFGSSSLHGTPVPGDQGIFVAPFEPTGTVRGVFSFGGQASEYRQVGIAAGTNAVHVSGPLTSDDLDPGPGTVLRFSSESSMFHATLDGAGAYRDAHLFPAYNYEYPEVAAGPSGSAIVALRGGGRGELRAYYADGASSWTLDIGEYFSLYRVASSATHFIAAGTENGTADYDPGPGSDAVYGPTPLVTRYVF